MAKALYGLRTSATGNLRKFDYFPFKVDPNLFYKDMEDLYEYVASFVDDTLTWPKDPMKVMAKLKAVYSMKGINIPEYYLGGNVKQMNEVCLKEDIQTGLSPGLTLRM